MDELQTYYVRRAGRVQGPWDLSRIRSEIALKKLTKFHEVSADGVAWTQARELVELFPSDERRKVLRKAGQQGNHPTRIVDFDAADGDWYYFVDDNQVGPVSRQELADAVLIGRCPLDALAWQERFGDQWQPIEQIPELMALIDVAPGARAGDVAGRTAYVDLAAHQQPWALYSLASGIATILLCWVPLLGFAGIIPIALGGYALYEMRKSSGPASGMAYALGGIVLGVGSVAVSVLVLLGVAVAVWMNA